MQAKTLGFQSITLSLIPNNGSEKTFSRTVTTKVLRNGRNNERNGKTRIKLVPKTMGIALLLSYEALNFEPYLTLEDISFSIILSTLNVNQSL